MTLSARGRRLGAGSVRGLRDARRGPRLCARGGFAAPGDGGGGEALAGRSVAGWGVRRSPGPRRGVVG
eukprot:13098328-Alexandrium_andersonii.AAC.1